MDPIAAVRRPFPVSAVFARAALLACAALAFSGCDLLDKILVVLRSLHLPAAAAPPERRQRYA